MVTKSITLTAPCLGCDAPITYQVQVEAGSGPEIYPLGHVHAYQSGHLCSVCSSAVETLLQDRKAARA